ncbi:MAG: hypothetical protein GEU75_02835 [Dehalococcoidia bacterium]|nr:hypothetical protein [Dehalococcoidia bacterium]
MSSANASIFEPKLSNNGQLHFELTLRDSAGQPIAGRDVRVSLDGDGSLAPRRSVKDVVRETNAEGSARVTWYRSSIFGRDVHATLSVETDLDAALTLTRLEREQVQTGPRTVWAPERHSWQK